MITAIEQERPETAAAGSPAARIAEIWLLMAALSQMAYLARWPLHVAGFTVGFGLALGIAITRAGLYLGLAWGLRNYPDSVRPLIGMEFARSVLLFALVFMLRDGASGDILYPAPWCQGVLSAALPLLIAVNSALAQGWRIGSVAHGQILLVAVGLSVAAAMLADSLWQQAAAARRRRGERGGYLRVAAAGLPVLIGMTAIEMGGVVLALLLSDR